MRRLHQHAARMEPSAVSGEVPVGEIRDELEQGPSQPLIRFDGLGPVFRPPVHLPEDPPRLSLEHLWAMRIARIRQQQRQEYRTR